MPVWVEKLSPDHWLKKNSLKLLRVCVKILIRLRILNQYLMMPKIQKI